MSDETKKKPGLFSRLLGGGAEPAGERTSGQDGTPRDKEVSAGGELAVEADGTPPESFADAPAGDATPPPPQAATNDDSETRSDTAEKDAAAAAEAEAPKQTGWLQRLKSGLTKTSSKLSQGITSVFTKRKLDAETLEDLEDLLIQADLGVETATRITEALARDRYNKEIAPEEVRRVLSQEVASVLEPVAKPLEIDPGHRPHVIMMVGVNGTGKTTTIGKLAARFRHEGKSVLLAAGDTFRAAAIEQLGVWGERTGVEVLSRKVGADAAGLAYDAVKHAQDNGIDVVMMDTAGRLQNKADLMAELGKIRRVMAKLDETAPHDVILVLDATTGQNAMQQVEVFRKTAGVTGLVMTKLDGTARGGILVAISAKHQLPVHAIGVGESIDDLQAFDPQAFADAIAGVSKDAAAAA